MAINFGDRAQKIFYRTFYKRLDAFVKETEEEPDVLKDQMFVSTSDEAIIINFLSAIKPYNQNGLGVGQNFQTQDEQMEMLSFFPDSSFIFGVCVKKREEVSPSVSDTSRLEVSEGFEAVI